MASHSAISPHSLTDASANTTTWAYDHLNRRTLETDPLSHTKPFSKEWECDRVGNLLVFQEELGRKIKYGYDDLDRRVEEKHYRPDGEHNGTTYLYGYDLGNRLLSLEKWGFETLVDTYAFTYDRLDRLTSETMNLDGLTHEIVLEHSYNQSSVRTELATSIGGTADLVNSYSYDGFNRLTQITQHGVSGGNAVAEKRVNFSYNAVDQLTGITRYAGLTTSNLVATSHYGYDLLSRLQSLTHDLNNAGLTDITYAYSWDRANRLTEINFSHDPDVTFDYDPRSQLLGAEYTNPLFDEEYEYDATGNRDSLDHVVGPNNRLLEDADYVYTYHDFDALHTRTHKHADLRDEYLYAHYGQLTVVFT